MIISTFDTEFPYNIFAFTCILCAIHVHIHKGQIESISTNLGLGNSTDGTRFAALSSSRQRTCSRGGISLSHTNE